MAPADYQALIISLVRDDTGKIAAGDRDSALALTVERYSRDRPRTKVEDLAGAGSQLLDLPAGWQADFSALGALEYPIGDVPPTLLRSEAWSLYDAPAGQKIMLLDAIAAGQSVRASYTVRHQLDGAGDTVPLGDREAVACWAAALLLDQLASLFAGDSDSTIGADVVDHNNKSAQYASRARVLRQRYFDALGIDPKRSVAAGVVVNLDQADSQGRDRLTHQRRFR